MSELWNRQRLEEIASQRNAALAGVPEIAGAALAFARWQGMTAEPGLDRAGAKAELDRRLDALDETPELWSQMKELVGLEHDQILRELMMYSLKRSSEQVKEMRRELEAEPVKAPSPAKPASEPSSSAKSGKPKFLRWRNRERED